MMMQQLGVGFGFDLCWELGNLGQPGWRCIFVFCILYIFLCFVFTYSAFMYFVFWSLLCSTFVGNKQSFVSRGDFVFCICVVCIFVSLYFRIFTFLYFVFLYCWELGNLGQGGDAACSLSWLVRYLPNLSSNPPHFLMPWKISISHSGFLET